jgi:uncharacterized coiled-coil protein SlyX
MKKLVLPVLLIFVLSFAMIAFSDEIQDVKAQIQASSKKMISIAKYGKDLQKKLAKAKKKRSKKQIAAINKQIAGLKKQKAANQAELVALKEKLADLESAAQASKYTPTTVTPTPITPAPVTPTPIPPKKAEIVPAWTGIAVEGVFGGGAGGLSLGYSMPITDTLAVKTSVAGYLGAEYSVMGAQIGLMQNFQSFYGSLNVDFASYSESVEGIIGIPTVDKGSVIGGGITLGKAMVLGNMTYTGSVGYSTALGLTAGIGVLF